MQVSYSGVSNSAAPPDEQMLNANATVLCNLAEGAQYTITINASTSKGWGPAASLNAWTEICSPDKPSPPVIKSTDWKTITVELKPVASKSCGPVTGYYVATAVTHSDITAASRRRRETLAEHLPVNFTVIAWFNASDIKETRNFVVGDDQWYNSSYHNAPLDSGNNYTVYYVVVSSLDNVTKMAVAQTSNSVMPTGATTPVATTMKSPSGLSDAAKIGIIVGVALPLVIFLVAALVYIICWECKRRPRTTVKEPDLSWLQYYTNNFGTSESSLKWTNISTVNEPRCVTFVNDAPPDLQVAALYQSRPVLSLADEYRMLPVGVIHPWTVARRPENSVLNGSQHLPPYDHSRVILASASTYINASYIPGYGQRRKAYIAAASPFNTQTIRDFWLMVYQERVSQVSAFNVLDARVKNLVCTH